MRICYHQSNLSIECKKHCGMYFSVNKLDAKGEHKKTCNNHHNSSISITLNKILALTPTKDISREIEDATYN